MVRRNADIILRNIWNMVVYHHLLMKLSLCAIYVKGLSAMMLWSRLKWRTTWKASILIRKTKILNISKFLKRNWELHLTWIHFFKSSASANSEGGLKTSYSISLNIAKKWKLYTIGEEIILPAIKDVTENVMKKDSQLVLKCTPLSANTVQWCIEEMANDVMHQLWQVVTEDFVSFSRKRCLLYVQFTVSYTGSIL